MDFMRRGVTLRWLGVIVLVISTVILFASCKKTRNPTAVLPESLLNIFPFNGSYEVDKNVNMHLGGRYVDDHNVPIKGATVHFSLEPPDYGTITTWAITEPESSNGFRQQVVFSGNRYAEVVIRGWVNRTTGSLAAEDTMHIQVRPPGND